MNTFQGRQQPQAVLKKSGDLREHSDQLLRRLKRLLHASEQFKTAACVYESPVG
jgi:hypothetical protein